MFKVATSPTFTHTVEVLVPIDDGHRPETFKATFRVQPASEMGRSDTSTVEGSTAWLKAIVVGMDDLAGEDGKRLPYSAELRDQLLDVPFVRAALTRTYLNAVNKAARGN